MHTCRERLDLISKGTGRNSAAFYDSNTFLEPALAKKYHREDIKSIPKPSPPGSVILVAAYNLPETSQSLKPLSATLPVETPYCELTPHTNRANELSPPHSAPRQFSDPPMGPTQLSQPSNQQNLLNKTTCQPTTPPNQPSLPTTVPNQPSTPATVPIQPSSLISYEGPRQPFLSLRKHKQLSFTRQRSSQTNYVFTSKKSCDDKQPTQISPMTPSLAIQPLLSKLSPMTPPSTSTPPSSPTVSPPSNSLATTHTTQKLVSPPSNSLATTHTTQKPVSPPTNSLATHTNQKLVGVSTEPPAESSIQLSSCPMTQQSNKTSSASDLMLTFSDDDFTTVPSPIHLHIALYPTMTLFMTVLILTQNIPASSYHHYYHLL